MPFYGIFTSPKFKNMPRTSWDDRIYFIESDRSNWLGGGSISFTSFRRPLHTHEILNQPENAFYHSPCPLPDGNLLASYRSILPGSCFGIYRISPESGERLDLIFEQENWHCIDTHPLVPHPRVSGRSSVANFELKTGIFYCLNSYITDRSGKDIPEGTIKRVRVIEGVPIKKNMQRFNIPPILDTAGPGSNQYTGTLFGPRRILGVAPVEEDGSFHIDVPAGIPINFQLLDENNVAVQTQYSWTWVMPKESRGCIGCHEDREMSPPNRMVEAVIKPAVKLTLPPERRRTVDFQNQISPIIQNKCSSMDCHSPGDARPNLDVTRLVEHKGSGAFFSQAYETLLSDIDGREGERYVYPGRAKDSPLIWHLFGKRLNDSNTHYTSDVTSMPPNEPLTPYERIQFIEWVDLGAQWNTPKINSTGFNKRGVE